MVQNMTAVLMAISLDLQIKTLFVSKNYHLGQAYVSVSDEQQ